MQLTEAKRYYYSTKIEASNIDQKSLFDTTDEIRDVIASCPNKSCDLDSIPTWLQYLHVIAGTALNGSSRTLNSETTMFVFQTPYHEDGQ